VSLIYPARRAVEHAVAIPGLRPTRFFAVLWPVWQVETTADVLDEQAYEVLDWFLVRGILHAEFSRVEELVAFFGLPEALVRRCLAFLGRIGHVRQDGDAVQLTQLGVQSAAENIRWEAKESRQVLLVERFTQRPLLRHHYRGSARVLDVPAVDPDDLDDRTRFHALFPPPGFRAEVIRDLAGRQDRAEYNLPARLHNLRVSDAPREGFLPVYLVTTADGEVLAYCNASEERDAFLEAVARDAPTLANLMDAAPTDRPQDVWTQWLAERPQLKGTLRRLPSGVWRATLRTDAFAGGTGRLPLTRLGSFEMRRHLFLQLWCEDRAQRLSAVLERAVHMAAPRVVKTRADLSRRVDAIARQLEVAAPGVDEILRQARRMQRFDRVMAIEELD
jgi:hypothetical protein